MTPTDNLALDGLKDEIIAFRSEFIAYCEGAKQDVAAMQQEITELKGWRVTHEAAAATRQALIEDQRRLIESSTASLKQQLAVYAAANTASTWREQMRQALRDVLPDELVDLERRQQLIEDQERGKMLREWREKNLTPRKITGALVAAGGLLASPQLIVFLVKWYVGG